METALCTDSRDDLSATASSFDLSDETGIRSVLYRANDLVLQCDALTEQCGAVRLSMQDHADLLTQIPLWDVDERDAAYMQIQHAETAYPALLQRLRTMNVQLQQAQLRLLNALSSLLAKESYRNPADMEECIKRLSQPLSLAAFENEIQHVADVLNDSLASPIALITRDPISAPPPPPPLYEPRKTPTQETPHRCNIHTDEEPLPHAPHQPNAASIWIKETTDAIRESVFLIVSLNSCGEDAVAQAQTAAICLRDLPLGGEERAEEIAWDDDSGKKPVTRNQAHEMLQRAEAAYHRLSRQSLEQHERIFSLQQELGRRIRALLQTSCFDAHNDPEGLKRETLLHLLPSLQQKHPFEGLQKILREVDSLLAQAQFRPTTMVEATRRERKEVARAHVRWMIRRDMPEVLGIEAESFEFPWLEEDFDRCLKQRNCIGSVAEEDGRVLGFMIYELHKTRIHVLNFAVAPGERGRGVATKMIEKLIEKLSSQRRSRLLLEVRESNAVAQVCFRNNGFRAISVLRGFYEDTPEDAYLMQYTYHES